jgi:hypothetical protein
LHKEDAVKSEQQHYVLFMRSSHTSSVRAAMVKSHVAGSAGVSTHA